MDKEDYIIKKLKKAYHKIDLNKDSLIDYDEFVAAFKNFYTEEGMMNMDTIKNIYYSCSGPEGARMSFDNKTRYR